MDTVCKSKDQLLVIELGTSRRLSSINIIASKLYQHQNIKMIWVSNKELEQEEDRKDNLIG